MAVVQVKTKKGRKASFKVNSIDSEDIPTVEPLEDDDNEDEALNLREVNDDDDSECLESESSEKEHPPEMHIHSVTTMNQSGRDLHNAEPLDVIKVKFGTFVQLLTNRDLLEAIEANEDEELIMKSNLLTELASADNKREERKVPLVFLIGIAIGVVLSYIFFST